MKFDKKPMLYVALIAIVILMAGVLYVNLVQSPANAAGCGMSGMDSDMSDCPMMGGSGSSSSHSGHSGNESSGVSSTALSGSILSVNKTQHKVSLRIDLPYSSEASSALSKAKVGDQITINVSLDKSGAPVVTGIGQSKGQTITLGITGVQCQACADRLQSSLESVPGVTGVTVSANPARATISYDPTKTSVSALKDAIRSTEPIHKGMPFGAVE